jgi:hypothetical protein
MGEFGEVGSAGKHGIPGMDWTCLMIYREQGHRN